MSQAVPGGLLFTLPREIRDDIYGRVLAQKYLVYGDPFWLHWEVLDDHDIEPKVPANLALLRLSKALHQEVSQVLFDHCIFRFAVDPAQVSDSTEGRVSTDLIPRVVASGAVQRMMNVEMVFNMAAWDDCERMFPTGEDDMENMCDSSVNLFVGTRVLRRSFRMAFHAITGCHTATILTTPFFQAIGKMSGFTTLTVQVDTYPVKKVDLVDDVKDTSDEEPDYDTLIKRVPDRIPCEAMGDWVSKEQLRGDWNEGQNFLGEILDALEPALGEWAVDNTTGAYNVGYSRYLEFRPRENHIKRLRAKLDRLTTSRWCVWPNTPIPLGSSDNV